MLRFCVHRIIWFVLLLGISFSRPGRMAVRSLGLVGVQGAEGVEKPTCAFILGVIWRGLVGGVKAKRGGRQHHPIRKVRRTRMALT